MSIYNNTNGLQEILNMTRVIGNNSNNGNVTQPTVQTYGTVSFTSNGDSATLSCGFQPDAIEIIHGTVDNGINCVGAIFSMASGQRHMELWSDQYEKYVWFDVTRTSNGITIKNIRWDSSDSTDSTIDSGDNFKWRAVKYT